MATSTLSQLLPALDIPPLGRQLRAAPGGKCQTRDEGEAHEEPMHSTNSDGRLTRKDSLLLSRD